MTVNDMDYTLTGKRVRLIHTDDKYNDLRENDEGTILYRFDNLDVMYLAIRWDVKEGETSGSNLSLIGVDQYEVL
jgi:spore coat protein CotH